MGEDRLFAPKYFSRRWHGEVDGRSILWRDMILIGTVINLVVAAIALMLLAMDTPTPIAVAVFFSPFPYNLFLLLSFLRSPQRTSTTTTIAIIWLVLVTFI